MFAQLCSWGKETDTSFPPLSCSELQSLGVSRTLISVWGEYKVMQNMNMDKPRCKAPASGMQLSPLPPAVSHLITGDSHPPYIVCNCKQRCLEDCQPQCAL